LELEKLKEDTKRNEKGLLNTKRFLEEHRKLLNATKTKIKKNLPEMMPLNRIVYIVDILNSSKTKRFIAV